MSRARRLPPYVPPAPRPAPEPSSPQGLLLPAPETGPPCSMHQAEEYRAWCERAIFGRREVPVIAPICERCRRELQRFAPKTA